MDPRVDRVIGIDTATPTISAPGLADVELRTVDIRTPEITRLLADSRIQAVVHLAIATSGDNQAGGRAAMKEHNVIGTMQLLAACQQAPELRKIVVRSSTAAYGASFRDPAVFTEDTEPRENPRGGFAKDVLDIEGYVRGFRRRRPDVLATVLRFAPLIGPTADPRLQFIHSDDALEVLHRSVVEDHPGTYNVAGAGVLTLSQAIRRAGRVVMPVVEPWLSAVAGFAKSWGLVDFSLDQLDLFVHGRVVDITALTKEYGFEPRSTAAAFDDFVRSQGFGPLGPYTVQAAEQVIGQRIRQARSIVKGNR